MEIDYIYWVRDRCEAQEMLNMENYSTHAYFDLIGKVFSYAFSLSLNTNEFLTRPRINKLELCRLFPYKAGI